MLFFLCRSGEQEWALKTGSPLHKKKEFSKRAVVIAKINFFTLKNNKVFIFYTGQQILGIR
jgi:hypothetical protein